MNVLVGCEESQIVANNFRKLGHLAYSCDIQECSGGHPEYHIISDLIKVINDGHFVTQNGAEHYISHWDLLIAHPPCTYLTVACNRAFSLDLPENTPESVVRRWDKRAQAAVFFMQIVSANCFRIAIENPVGYMNKVYRKPDQIIHPYYFAETKNSIDYNLKRTCLWLKNLPLLVRTSHLEKPEPIAYCKGEPQYFHDFCYSKGVSLSKARSKTFPGIARAMAEQWSNL